MSVHRLNEEVAQLRRFRNRADPDLSLSQLLRSTCGDLERRARGAGRVAAAWAEVIPPHLAGGTQVVGLSRGILTIRAADSAVRFQLDRFLRSGGQVQLARAASAPIRRIKII